MAVVAALGVVPARAAADTSVLYNDYARDRVLSCKYSRADLRAALTDATLNQYGDPYTIVGLKLAVRKQLAGSCGTSGPAARTDGRAEDESSGDDRTLVLGACFLVLTLGAGGWAARRAFTRKR